MQIRTNVFAPSRALAPLASVLLVAVTGCGSDVKREDMSGAVTFDGKPVVYGSIEFVPDGQKGHTGPSGHADIVDGKYDTSVEGGTGIVVGPHQIQITAYEEVPPPASEDETKPSTAKPPLFFGYTVEEDLQGGTKDFAVPADAKGFGLSGGRSRRRANDP